MILRLSLVIALLLRVLNSEAQTAGVRFSYRLGNQTIYQNSNYYYFVRADTVLANHGVSQVVECRWDGTANTTERHKTCQIKQYDTAGRVVEEFEKSGNRKMKPTASFEYTTAGKLHQARYPGRKTSVLYTYHTNGKPSSFLLTRNGKIKKFTRTIFNDSGLSTATFIFGKDTANYETVYRQYYANDTGKMVRSEWRNRKGKLISAMDYNCEPTGALSKTELKKETRVCISDTRRGDGLREYVYEYRGFDNLFRYIYYTDSLDRTVKYLQYAGRMGDKLRQTTEYMYHDSGSSSLNTSYNTKNGRPEWRSHSVYSASNKKIQSMNEWFGRSGEVTNAWASRYEYNNGLLVRSSGWNTLKPRSTSVTEYRHSFFGTADN